MNVKVAKPDIAILQVVVKPVVQKVAKRLSAPRVERSHVDHVPKIESLMTRKRIEPNPINQRDLRRKIHSKDGSHLKFIISTYVILF